jgi:Oxidoreductase family, NAD-binding Rossmann fold
MHLEVALAFAEQGYHILCEKPIATSLEDCLRMEAAIKKAGTIFGAGHGLVHLCCTLCYNSHNCCSHAILAVQSRYLRYCPIWCSG